MQQFIPGLQLSQHFFTDVVQPLLSSHYPNLKYSAARIGPGSDVLGYDDAMSADHDWGPQLQLFLRRDDFIAHREAIDELFTTQLPPTFKGYSTHFGAPDPTDSGTQTPAVSTGNRINHRITFHTPRHYIHGLMRFDIEQPLTSADWLSFPQQHLLELTAGKLFHDALNLSSLREKFNYFPHDVWLYLMAAGWGRINQEEHLMGRAGYRGDEIGSALIGSRLVRDIMSLCFLLERRYMPYPKWLGTAFGQLPCAAEIQPHLSAALTAPSWTQRETALSHAYARLVQLHNRKGITNAVSAETVNFFTRPFQVITFNGIIPALVAQINDPHIQQLAKKPLIGSIDQMSDNTDFLSNPMWRPMIRAFYI